jgi:hypothetical protein
VSGKKVLEERSHFQNCHIKELDNGSLALIVFGCNPRLFLKCYNIGVSGRFIDNCWRLIKVVED